MPQPTAKAVDTDLRATIAALRAAAKILDTLAREFEKAGIGNLTDAQKTRWKAINKARIEIARQIARYSLLLILQLNSSAKAKTLANKVKAANEKLTAAVNQINATFKLLDNVATILAAADKLLKTALAFAAIA